EYHGAVFARLAAAGPQADASLALCAETLELLLHHAHARELAAATHAEAMRLTFAELTEHNARLSRAVARLGELVASELATFAPQAGRRGIAIQLDACSDTVVIGDRRKIRQVVSSLVSNAVKFTPDRGKVGVAVRRGPLAVHEPGAPDAGAAIQL